ncbi:hypothetical protein C357_18772 [Citreicella sp. 357]|nr:hypothetical protein C357_18772 [Citreicella sp. 357]
MPRARDFDMRRIARGLRKPTAFCRAAGCFSTPATTASTGFRGSATPP